VSAILVESYIPGKGTDENRVCKEEGRIRTKWRGTSLFN
jgi:hypothetical protein